MSNLNSMTKQNGSILIKYSLIMLLFLAFLLSLRLLWVQWNAPASIPAIEKGFIDLSDWDFTKNRPLALNGEWEFYPNSFETEGEPSYVQVPGSWQAGNAFGAADNAYGYGVYQLTIAIPGPVKEDPYTFWIKQAETASITEINGKPSFEFGVPADNKADYIPRRAGYTPSYEPAQGETLLVLKIKAANFDNPYRGGLIKPVMLGLQSSVDTVRWYSIGLQLSTFVILLLHGIYAAILYVLDLTKKAFLIFFSLLASAGISIIVSHDYLLLYWLPINYDWTVKLTLLSYINLTFFMLLLTRNFAKTTRDKGWFRFYTLLHLLYCVFTLVASAPTVQYSVKYKLFDFFYMLPVLWFLALIVFMLIKRRPGAIFLMLAAMSILSSVIWGVLSSRQVVYGEYYPFDILIAIISFSTYWFKSYMSNASENARLNAKLRAADEVKDRFLAHTSHELRTPLHGIINIAQSIVSREQDMDKRSIKDIGLLLKISKRMSSLLDDLLELLTLKENGIRLHLSPLKLDAVVPGVLDMLAYLTENKPVKLISAIPVNLPPIQADEKRLIQILFNLVHNAIKHTREGSITVSAEEAGGAIIIKVTDTGAGIRENDLKVIFLPYEQGADGEGGGFGLGLNICKQLVELHGGQLDVRSEPGKGTTFQFSLPQADYSVAAADSEQGIEPVNPVFVEGTEDNAWEESWRAAGSGQEGEINQGQILAVDDDPVNLRILSTILGSGPYQLTLATSGKEALRLLPTRQWDLVITDVMMPSMNGYELTREIRERYSISELPILVLTARSQPADVYAGFSAGANDYLTKPVDGLELKYRVWSLTTLKRSVTERLRMEAAYLQAQIHPHFLFNTLSSILALSEIDSEKMRRLAEAFTSYLRISFHFLNAGELVVLSHELELVRAYLYIEKERFEERLHVNWEIQQEIHLYLPPLSIQPLVENAVKHGIMSLSRGGTITIAIHRQDDEVVIDIRDNGKGMTQDKADKLLKKAFDREGGIGIANTHRRLIQHYGKGLFIQSAPDQGTSISFRIPDRHAPN
ncbi:histidine kinase [Paenibacillus oryzae]|uniref:histidine kinase n=1 Tax=Paenibacillus oryzae TaxID=1844972 RepID=A0A1A5YH61_9BACL|nr:ATP-binding protein [Paenibacillus oryzae]OBR64740.1 histidine kinase [Paenibacillus oryzae]